MPPSLVWPGVGDLKLTQESAEPAGSRGLPAWAVGSAAPVRREAALALRCLGASEQKVSWRGGGRGGGRKGEKMEVAGEREVEGKKEGVREGNGFLKITTERRSQEA